MLIEILAALALGILAGTFTGLAPGIHINLISALLVSSIPALPFAPLALAIFIASMAIAHTFTDFIPSIYLGAPEEDTFLAVLPGHEMLLEGKGHEAVTLALYGSLTALVVIIIMAVPFIYIMPLFEEKISFLIPFILIFLSLYLVLREDNIFLAISIFLLAGFLGFATLNLPVKEPLLPLLTGLFGASALVLSIKNKEKIKRQKIFQLKKIRIEKKEVKNALLGSFIIAPICSFIPAVGSGYAAILSSEIFPQTRRGFLFLNGSLNVIVMALSFVIIYSLGKARTGAAAAVKEILGNITLSHVIAIIIVVIISSIISFIIGIKISKLFAKNINKINYSRLSKVVLALLAIVVLLFSGWLGLLIFATSSSLGIFTIKSGIRRTSLMAALIVPTILIYLF